jgi:hypothetical protein
VNQLVTPSNANTTNPRLVTFAHFHYTFTANSSTTTIQFSDVRTGNSTGDVVLDSVVIRTP